LEQAANNFNNAKAQYDKVAKGADSAQLQSALQQVQNAQSQLDRVINKAADSAQVASAVQQIQSAKANLDKLKQPARAFDVEQAEAQRKQAELQRKQAEAGLTQARIQKQTAELSMKQAKRRIEQATLAAPGDGIVKDLNLKAGELVGAGAALTLVDTGLLHIDVTVDEIDIARVRVNQDVNVTLDALPGKSYKAKVDRVSPTSRLVNGVVSYDVRVLLPDDPDLRVGMTSSASITLDRRENALAAPNWAVRRDRKAGKNFLTLREGDKSREIEVQVGLRNDQFTEILGGATEGMIVVAPEVPNALGN
jgi:RND family efflux transporter MFP subunit